MQARRRWATGVVVVVAVAAGAGGGAYLWREATAIDAGPRGDGGLGGDASADAGRGKAKLAKRGGRSGLGARPGQRPGKPRPHPGASGASGASAGGHDEELVDEGGDEAMEDFQPPFRGRGPAGPTYEAAIAANRQEVTIGGKAEPDLTDGQLAGPMRDGAFVGECGAPERMKVTVKVAIKMGHAAGVSVSTSPHDPDIAGCIDRYVRTFSWPPHPKMDSFTTTY